MRILIAHGDDLVLAGLRQALAADAGFEIAAEAHDALTLVSLVGQTSAEVVLLDADFPGIGGLEGLRRLRAGHPHLKIVMSGRAASLDVLEDAVAEGACGYIVDRMSASDVGAAILRAIDSHHSAAAVNPALPGWAAGFTPREASVIEAVARGLPNKAIADELHITERTVKFHLTTVYRKLGVSNRTEAARWALTQGIAA